MASIDIPIKVNLPDNWEEIIAEKLKQDDDYVLVTRCKDCKYRSNEDASPTQLPCMYIDTDDKWFCGYGEQKEKK